MTFGTFIQPHPGLAGDADPARTLELPVYSEYHALDQAAHCRGQNRLFDTILDRSQVLDLRYEDQCSPQYYFDLVRTLRDFNGEFERVVEVGVYLGGASGVIAGCMDAFGFDLDMVDINAECLQFAHERVRRMYPQAAKRIRLFHGDVPSYVQAIMAERACRTIVHHDGAHDFNQVVHDMAALSFVRERLCAIIAQDTHLRGTLKHMNFVDMAMYAVFGLDLNYAPIGAAYAFEDNRTAPNQYQGNYFMPEAPEGFVLPMNINEFHYPHPDLKIEDFLPMRPTLAA
ncbi:Class I SAM-dependent methyltransferase [Sphingomonas antarctica]|uniref:hypothetical protein n=1 Tax=Sphingomonas antarctica TaxID=2040274 RepID=UPI0039ECAE84